MHFQRALRVHAVRFNPEIVKSFTKRRSYESFKQGEGFSVPVSVVAWIRLCASGALAGIIGNGFLLLITNKGD